MCVGPDASLPDPGVAHLLAFTYDSVRGCCHIFGTGRPGRQFGA